MRVNASVTLYTAPAGAGKTQLLCQKVAGALENDALPHVVVIVPSPFLRREFRRRLLEESSRPLFGVEILILPDLCSSLLNSAGLPCLEIGAIVQRQLLGTVVESLLTDDLLPYYSPIAHRPGFINVMSEFIAELKRGLIRPSDFSAVADARSDKDRDLAAIYSAYHRLLQERQLADQEGVMWLARDELAGDPHLGAPIHLLAVDGLEKPSPLQLELITFLAARAEETAIALTYEEGRSSLDRGKRAFEALTEALDPVVVRMPPGGGDPGSPLGFLERHLFDLDPVEQLDGHQEVRVLQAPARYPEIKEVAREVKRLLLQGVSPGQITILFRSLEPYVSLVHQVFDEFGIPVLVRGGRALSENPLVASLLRLLTLTSDDFPRRGVIATLRSPYFDFARYGFGAQEISALDRISRERIVTSGRDMWREALEFEAQRSAVHRHGAGSSSDPGTEVHPSQLLEKLETLFDEVTPRLDATSQGYTAFVEELIGDDPRESSRPGSGRKQHETWSLRVVEGVLAGPFDLRVRDLNALQEVKTVLRDVVQAAALTGSKTISWSEFLANFRHALSVSRYTLHQSSAGRVVAQKVIQARGLTYEYAFLVGLAEGEFPRSTRVDILYDQREREELLAAGLHVELGPGLDEPYLFYQAVTRATRSLYLSYPYLDDEGRDLLPSPYLREITRLLKLDSPTRVRLGSSASLAEVASHAEFCIAAAEALEQHDRDGLAAHNALVALPAWRSVLKGRELEMTRQSPGTFGPFDGVLVSQDVLALLKARYGETYVWSPSSLSEYGTCPFKFFAHRLLRLEEPEEPEVGLDARQLGSIYHTILERLYGILIDEGIPVEHDRLDEVLEIARSVGAQVLQSAPRQAGFRPSALWKLEKEEILARVERLIAAEAKQNAKDSNGFVPIMTEARFGRGHTIPLIIDAQPGKVAIAGRIDRVDQSPQGLRVLDYKTGQAPGRKEIAEGRDLQLPLYVLAARDVLLPGQEVLETFYYRINAAKRSTILRSTKKGEPDPQWQEMLDRTADYVGDYVHSVRAGLFPVLPSGDCPTYCDFADICRKVLVSERKKLPSEPTDG